MRRIFINFCKDHLFFSMVYFISNLLTAIFYYIVTDSRLEIMYPFSITLFIYIICISYKWFTYSEFNKNMKMLISNMNQHIKSYTIEEKEFAEVVFNVHKHYMEKNNEVNTNEQNRRRFLSQWIHNMKTPISVIDLIIQKTDRGEIDKDTALKDIKKENNSLYQKLDQVLNLMRLEDFIQDYVPHQVNLNTSVRNVINNRKNQFIYSGVYPKVEVDEEEIRVLSDEKWNEAMLEQIVSNAIKYSGEKGKKVFFRIKREGDRVILSVRDEGIGIPKHDLNRIFRPYFTGENGRFTSGSSGIGLYFCSQVAEKLGHNLNISSKHGEGTEVSITYLSIL